MTLAAAGLPTPGIISNHSPLASLNHLNRSQQSFKYDHLRKEASDYKPWSADSEVLEGFLETWPIIENKCFHIWYWCIKVEGLRAAIEAEVTAYALNHYRHGVSATFSKPTERYHYCIKIHVKPSFFVYHLVWIGPGMFWNIFQNIFSAVGFLWKILLLEKWK